MNRAVTSIDYGVDPDAGLVRVVARRSLVDRDVRDCVHRSAADVNIRPGMDLIIDLCSASKSCVTDIGAKDSLLVLRAFGPLVVGNRMALVADHPEAERRIFRMILAPYSTSVRLFGDLRDAEDWLRRRESP